MLLFWFVSPLVDIGKVYREDPMPKSHRHCSLRITKLGTFLIAASFCDYEIGASILPAAYRVFSMMLIAYLLLICVFSSAGFTTQVTRLFLEN